MAITIFNANLTTSTDSDAASGMTASVQGAPTAALGGQQFDGVDDGIIYAPPEPTGSLINGFDGVTAASTGPANTGLAYDASGDRWFVAKFHSTESDSAILQFPSGFPGDPTTTTPTSTLSLAMRPQGLAWVPGVGLAVAFPADEVVVIYDPDDSWSLVRTIAMPSGFAVNSLAYAPTNGRLYALESGNTTLRIFDPSDGTSQGTLSLSVSSEINAGGMDQMAWWASEKLIVVSVDRFLTVTEEYIIAFDLSGTQKHIAPFPVPDIEGLVILNNDVAYINSDTGFKIGNTTDNKLFEFSPNALFAVSRTGKGTFTIGLTISSSANATEAVIVQGNPVNGTGWGIYSLNGGTKIRLFLRDGTNSVFYDYTTGSGSHVVILTVDRQLQQITCTVDGNVTSADVGDGSISSVTGRITQVASGDYRLSLAHSPDGDLPRWFEGLIDDVTITRPSTGNRRRRLLIGAA